MTEAALAHSLAAHLAGPVPARRRPARPAAAARPGRASVADPAPHEPRAPAQLRLVLDDPAPPAPAPRSPTLPQPRYPQPQPQPQHKILPPPLPALQRLALAAFEAIEGARAISQLAGTITPEVARELRARRVARTERRTLYRDQRRIVASPGPAHLSQPAPGVVEAAVVLHARGRTSAVALRLEYRGARWRATSITVL